MLRKFSFFILLLIFSCQNKDATSATAEAQAAGEGPTGLSSELPSGFHDFYDRFHSDSAFQLDHVVFPLMGEMSRSDSTETLTLEKKYLKDEWKLHQPYNPELGFNRGFTVLGNLVLEKMQDNMGLLTIERRWGKVDSTWSLIYYGTAEKSW